MFKMVKIIKSSDNDLRRNEPRLLNELVESGRGVSHGEPAWMVPFAGEALAAETEEVSAQHMPDLKDGYLSPREGQRCRKTRRLPREDIGTVPGSVNAFQLFRS